MTITITAQTYGDSSGLPSDPSTAGTHERTSILAPFADIIECSTDASIEGSIIYFSPAMFGNPALAPTWSGAPPRGWRITMPATISSGGFSTLTPFGLSGYELQRDFSEVTIEWFDANTFRIFHNFRMLADHGGYMPSGSQDSLGLILKNHRLNPSSLSNVFTSVYNQLSYNYTSQIYIQGTSLALTGSVNAEFAIVPKFYNTFPAPTASYGFTSALSRTSGTVFDLSTFENTKFTGTLKVPQGYVADDAIAFIFRSDASYPTNLQPIEVDVDMDNMAMYNDPSSVQLMNKIWGPMVKPASIGSLQWRCSFHVGAADIDPGASYYVALVWYVKPNVADLEQTFTVTMLSGPYKVEATPEPIKDLIITGEFDDYAKTQSVQRPQYPPALRYKWRAIIDGTVYNTVAAGLGSPFGSLATDMQTIVIQVLNTPTAEAFIAYRSGATWIVSHPALKILDFGAIVYAELDFRAMYGGAFDSWIGDVVDFQIECGFDYVALGGFFVYYRYTDQCRIKAFAGGQKPIITAINYFNARTGAPLTMVCGDDDILVQVIMNTGDVSDPTEYVFQGLVDKAPGGTNLYTDAGLKEGESEPALTIAAKIQTPIYDVDARFSASGEAYFKIIAGLLTPGIQYNVAGAAILKP